MDGGEPGRPYVETDEEGGDGELEREEGVDLFDELGSAFGLKVGVSVVVFVVHFLFMLV